MKKEDKILVTGASGFVGGRLVELLSLTNYMPVRACIRNWANSTRIGRFPIEIVKCDLMNKNEIADALDGITYIVHCAKGPGGVTSDGTKNILDIALKKGIKKFIHISTTEVYGNCNGEITEESDFKYTGSEYNKSKIIAEEYCFEYSKKKLPVAILRPPIIYGPFSTYWTVYFARVLLDKKWGLYDKYGNGFCNLLYIDDLVRAILLTIENNASNGQAFNINGPDKITWNEYFIKFNKKLGLPDLERITERNSKIRTKIVQPVRLLGRYVQKKHMNKVKFLSDRFSVIDNILRQAEKQIKYTPGPDDLALYNRAVIYKTSKAEKLLDYIPIFNIETGLDISVAWLKHHGFLINNN